MYSGAEFGLMPKESRKDNNEIGGGGLKLLNYYSVIVNLFGVDMTVKVRDVEAEIATPSEVICRSCGKKIVVQKNTVHIISVDRADLGRMPYNHPHYGMASDLAQAKARAIKKLDKCPECKKNYSA